MTVAPPDSLLDEEPGSPSVPAESLLRLLQGTGAIPPDSRRLPCFFEAAHEHLAAPGALSLQRTGRTMHQPLDYDLAVLLREDAVRAHRLQPPELFLPSVLQEGVEVKLDRDRKDGDSSQHYGYPESGRQKVPFRWQFGFRRADLPKLAEPAPTIHGAALPPLAAPAFGLGLPGTGHVGRPPWVARMWSGGPGGIPPGQRLS